MSIRTFRTAILSLVVVCWTFVAAGVARAADDDAPPPAPDFNLADGWLNTEKPISIASLKGQVVIVDFWTYCCVNCMHIMPDLKFIEEKYKDQPVVVIGVHSGKFDEEKDADHIRQAVLRHNLEHPIAIDSDMKVWKSYGVHAWPTLIVIAPDGNIVGALSGEGHRDQLDRAVAALLDIYGKKNQLAKHMTFRTERSIFKSGALEFPGKVLADAAGKRLFVSDTNHHRIVVADMAGKIQQTIGTGAMGLKDGGFEQAQFYQPQGLALSEDGKTLYVADTENHAVRAVDLEKKAVTTLAGNGHQWRGKMLDGSAKEAELSSPWDVSLVGKRLYIAMAGTHQIWMLDLAADQIIMFAGTRRESAVDGPRGKSAFAQPSGLTNDGSTLYVADSEVSSVRAVELGANGVVSTLAGSSNLFGFGLKDATGDAARFQHPLGIALKGQTLYVADTFNNVLRTVDVKSGEVKTFLGTGKRDVGTEDAIGFYEPGGLSIAGDVLYVADTNHHRILAVDLKTKKSVVLIGDTAQDAEAPKNTAVQPVPKLENDSYDWEKRHEEELATKDKLQPRVVMIGDSITHFWGGPPVSKIQNGPLAWKDAFGDVPVLNLGFGWDRTQNVLWRLDHGEFDGLHPKTVVINIGTNNFTGTSHARENTPAEVYEGIMAICQRVHAKSPDSRIIVMGVFPRGQKPGVGLRPKITALNELLAKGVAGKKGIEFLDIGPQLLEPDGTISRDIMRDFTHPTEKGYAVWAKALVAAGIRD